MIRGKSSKKYTLGIIRRKNTPAWDTAGSLAVASCGFTALARCVVGAIAGAGDGVSRAAAGAAAGVVLTLQLALVSLSCFYFVFPDHCLGFFATF